MMTVKEEMDTICAYVAQERKRLGIVPGRVRLLELSCETVGEFRNLVDRQLVHTEEGFGAWDELNYSPVRTGASRYASKKMRGS